MLNALRLEEYVVPSLPPFLQDPLPWKTHYERENRREPPCASIKAQHSKMKAYSNYGPNTYHSRTLIGTHANWYRPV